MQDETSIVLTELELDALTELVNLGVSSAAFSLREMVREEVTLSVPRVQIVTRDEAVANLGGGESRRLVGVRQDFEGEMNGRALLIFPEDRSIELVRAIVGGALSIQEIVELEHEALAETGNVLLNGCLSTLANYLGQSLHVSLPEVIHGEGFQFFDATQQSNSGDRVLLTYINFTIRHRDIQGHIAMLLDMPSLAILKRLVGEFIDRTAGVATSASSHTS
jgi:chemotaxis protein CheC